MFRSRFRQLSAIGIAALLLMAVFYGLAASNTVPESYAGYGAGDVSGYTISDIAYTFGADPSTIDEVAFTIAPITGTVTISLDGGSAWYTCINTTGSVACDTTSPSVTTSGVVTLTVAAAQ